MTEKERQKYKALQDSLKCCPWCEGVKPSIRVQLCGRGYTPYTAVIMQCPQCKVEKTYLPTDAEDSAGGYSNYSPDGNIKLMLHVADKLRAKWNTRP